MYGLVNQGVRDLAVELGGEALWAEIKSASGIEQEAFVAMDGYDDEVTYRLVDAASRVLKMTPSEVLRAFGKHWILYTGRRGYGPLFDMMGRTLPEFLANLDSMHARLRLSMPQLRPPTIVSELLSEGHIRLEYWSERDGLAPMVVGLVEGLADVFDLDLTVTATQDRSTSDHDEFLLDYSPRGALLDRPTFVGTVMTELNMTKLTTARSNMGGASG